MANENIRKQYEGGVAPTTLDISISAVDTTIVLADGTSFPDATHPFVIAIGRGTTSEEKILCDSRSTNTLSVLERGYDGTTAQIHAGGESVDHVIDAHTLDQANQMANTWTTEGDILYRSSTGAPGRLAVGGTGTVLRGGGTTPAYGEVQLVDLADALVEVLCPAGTVDMYLGSTQPTGWLFHNQTVIGGDVTYPTLWAKLPSSWKSGSNIVVPDLTDVVLAQAGTTVLGATGGANTVTLIEANLPAHTHTMAHTHDVTHGHAGSTASSSSTTSVTIIDPGHTHDLQRNALSGTSTGAEQILQTQYNSGTTYSATQGNTTGITATASTSTSTTVSISAPTLNTGASSAASTGSAGSGTAVNIRSKHLALNIKIKAH